MPFRIVKSIAVAAVFVALAFIVLLAGAWWEIGATDGDAITPVYVVMQVGLPLAASVAVWRGLGAARPVDTEPPRSGWGWGLRVAATAYLLTAILGVPRVQSEATAWAVAEYKQLKAVTARWTHQ